MQALEERVAFLEKELRRLQAEVLGQKGTVSGRTAPDFLERFSGIFGDDPTFAEAARLGRAWREEEPEEAPAGAEGMPS